MNAQSPRADLSRPEQLIAYFVGVIVTSAALTIWSAITRTARAATNLLRRQR